MSALAKSSLIGGFGFTLIKKGELIMTFAEILINTMKDKPEVVNFFDYLFYAKQYCMILENIEGEGINSLSPEQLRELEIGFINVSSTGQLTNLLISFTVSVKGRIAEKAKNSLEVENLLDEMISKNLNTKVSIVSVVYRLDIVFELKNVHTNGNLILQILITIVFTLAHKMNWRISLGSM